MFRKTSAFYVISLLAALMLASGCSRAPVKVIQPAGPTAAASATPSGSVPVTSGGQTPGGGAITSTQPPALNMSKSANSCELINSNDLAHLFPPHNEITRSAPKTGPVSHPPFSTDATSGTETTCMYYDFHLPGSKTGWMLQVTYLVDTPEPAMRQAWSAAWESAKAKSSQPVSGLGDGAFARDVNLYIKKGDTYLTFESIDTHVDEKTPAGQQQLLADEEQLAQSALQRLK